MRRRFLQRPDGVRIAYDVHNPAGTGVPLLLTHGFGATARMWDANTGPLAADRPVIVWDHRGHGASDAPADPAAYSEEISVADMAALLDAVGAPRAVVCGMSLGGFLSLAFHLAHPQRVAALVLVDTGPGYRNDGARERWNERVAAIAARLEADGTATGSASAEVAQAVHEHPGGLPRVARGVMAQRDARVIDSLAAITVPTLVVVGAQDTHYRTGADYMESHIPDARKVVIDDAGHASNMDQPAVFNRAVLDLLEQI